MQLTAKLFITGFTLFFVPGTYGGSLQASQQSSNPIRIVLSSNPSPPEKFAAEELTKYLAAMGNPAPKVLAGEQAGDIYLGTLARLADSDKTAVEATLSGKDPDSFIIRTVGKSLLIFGNSPRGTLFGAYHYLETLGVRWYFPGKENEVVPQASVKTEGYDIRSIPSFRKRGIVSFRHAPGFDEIVDFAAKKRLNTIALHSDQGLQEVEQALKTRGLKVNLERHFFGAHFCPDDKKTLEQQKKQLRNYVKNLKVELDQLFLWAADEFLAPCKSSRYQDYNVSDLILNFSNHAVAMLREAQPSQKFAFLSYLSTWEPPKHVKPSEGVFLEWAPMFQSFACSLGDPQCTANLQYQRALESHLKLFQPEEAQVLGYWLDDTLFSRTKYGKLPFVPKVLAEELKYYYEQGIRQITTFAILTGRDYWMSHASPVIFLYPELLWDIQGDPGAIMKEFCRLYFGEEELYRVFELLERADQRVFIEGHQLKTGNLNRPDFVGAVDEALRLASEYVQKEADPVRRARGARLAAEVSSRFVSGNP